MTIFSTAEEQQREPLEIGGKVLFYPDFALSTAGGDVSVLAPWKSYVLQDRELISGQNPFSDQALLKLLLPALNGKTKRVGKEGAGDLPLCPVFITSPVRPPHPLRFLMGERHAYHSSGGRMR